jgi:hypothetical protein
MDDFQYTQHSYRRDASQRKRTLRRDSTRQSTNSRETNPKQSSRITFALKYSIPPLCPRENSPLGKRKFPGSEKQILRV